MSGDDSWPAGDDDETLESGGGYRGWIDPDDRLWRHPSEGPRPSAAGPGVGFHNAGPLTPAQLLADGHLGRRGPATWLICGSICVALVVAAVAVVVADSGEDSTTALTTALPLAHSAPTTEPGSASTDGELRLATAVAGVRPSTVTVRVAGGGRSSTVVGVVVESGGIVVTTAKPLSSARRITVVEPDGTRRPAVLVGVDRTSDLAVLRIADDLPAANFDAVDPSVGSPGMAVTVRPRPGSDSVSLVYAGTVVSSGAAVSGDPVTATFASTSVRAPLGTDDVGCPLVDSSGRVMGLLHVTSTTESGRVAVFLPAALVAGVARQLVSAGGLDHGWLGVGGAMSRTDLSTTVATRSSSGPTGAVVTSVAKDSPAAAAGLAPGAVVQAVDGAPVHSMAELMTRLYPDPPGTSVAVTFETGQSTETVEVELADRAGASSATTSP